MDFFILFTTLSKIYSLYFSRVLSKRSRKVHYYYNFFFATKEVSFLVDETLQSIKWVAFFWSRTFIPLLFRPQSLFRKNLRIQKVKFRKNLFFLCATGLTRNETKPKNNNQFVATKYIHRLGLILSSFCFFVVNPIHYLSDVSFCGGPVGSFHKQTRFSIRGNFPRLG